MAKVIATGRGVSVVVNRDRNTAVIRPAIQTLKVRDQVAVNTVTDRASTVQVSSPGVQGPKGDPGADTGEVIDQAMAAHLAAPDPHPGYIDADDTLDGGNF